MTPPSEGFFITIDCEVGQDVQVSVQVGKLRYLFVWERNTL